LNLPVKATWDPETWTKTCLALITELQEPGTKPALPPASWASKTLAPPTAILRSEPPPGQLPWTLKLPINYFRFLGFGNGNSDKTCNVLHASLPQLIGMGRAQIGPASATWYQEGCHRLCPIPIATWDPGTSAAWSLPRPQLPGSGRARIGLKTTEPVLYV
jgi:hypothetical protein